MEITQLYPNTWSFDEGGVRFFLLAGTKRALLIDSGMTTPNVRALAAQYTSLPLFLLNTHADPDHIGGNAEFSRFYMNPAEGANYYTQQKRTDGELVPVENGDVLDLGDRPLTIITTPGHTPGSIAVLDERNRALFSGDPVQDGNIYMFGPQRDLHAYRLSLEKLNAMKERFDRIYPSHGSLCVSPELIEKLIKGAQQVLDKTAPAEELALHGQRVLRYDVGCAGFYCGS